jgi:signal transduction histidine kinase
MTKEVDSYINKSPDLVQDGLKQIRKIIKEVSPGQLRELTISKFLVTLILDMIMTGCLFGLVTKTNQSDFMCAHL